MYLKDFLDKEIVGSDGWKIGKSKEVICDPKTWQITQIEVELNEKIESEMGEPLAYRHNRVPLDITFVQGVGDMITLKTTKEEIVKALAVVIIARQAEAPHSGPIVV